MAGIQAPSTGLPSSQEKSKSIADLQAQIAARLKNVGIPSLVGAGRPGGPVVPAGPIAGHQVLSLIQFFITLFFSLVLVVCGGQVLFKGLRVSLTDI